MITIALVEPVGNNILCLDLECSSVHPGVTPVHRPKHFQDLYRETMYFCTFWQNLNLINKL